MRAFTVHRGLVAPMEGENINTDAILPKQFMKSIERTGFGAHLFDGQRYLDYGEPGIDCTLRPLNPRFVLNLPRYQGASVLLAQRNFGCGSSREHAPWALDQFGFRVLLAPSFGEIFAGNCFRNGLLPLALEESIIHDLFQEVRDTPGYWIEVDLLEQRLKTCSGRVLSLSVDAERRQRLLQGLDEIDATLALRDAIERHEAWSRRYRPWLFERQAGDPAP